MQCDLTSFPATQSARRDLIPFKQFVVALPQIFVGCPEFRTEPSSCGENRAFQGIAIKVIGEYVVGVPTRLCIG